MSTPRRPAPRSNGAPMIAAFMASDATSRAGRAPPVGRGGAGGRRAAPTRAEAGREPLRRPRAPCLLDQLGELVVGDAGEVDAGADQLTPGDGGERLGLGGDER